MLSYGLNLQIFVWILIISPLIFCYAHFDVVFVMDFYTDAGMRFNFEHLLSLFFRGTILMEPVYCCALVP